MQEIEADCNVKALNAVYQQLVQFLTTQNPDNVLPSWKMLCCYGQVKY